jgi:hypothetical protein
MPTLNPQFLLTVSTTVVPCLLACVVVVALAACWRAPLYWKPDRISARATTLSEIDAVLRGRWDVFAEAAPGVLVVLGLLGTFCGLAAAISSFQGLVATHTAEAPDALVSRLTPILSGMGAKFVSSILGITASLITRVFVSLLLSSRRLEVARSLLRSAEDLRAEQEKNLMNVFTSIRDLGHESAQRVDEIRAHLVSHKTTVTQGIASMSGILGELTAATKDLGVQISNQATVAERENGKVVQSIKNLGDHAINAISRSDALISRSDAIVTHLAGHKNTFDQMYARMSDIDAKVPTRQQAVDSIELQKKVRGILEISLTSQQSSAEMLEHFAGASVALKSGADSVSSAAKEMAVNTESLRKTIGDMQTAVDAMAQAGIDQMVTGAKSLEDASMGLKTSIEASMDSFKNSVANSLGELKEDLTGVTASIKGSVEESSSAVTKGIELMNGSVVGLKNSITPALEELTRSTDSSVRAANLLAGQIEVMQGLHASQDETSRKLIGHVEKMSEATGNIARQVRQAEEIRSKNGSNVEVAVDKLRDAVVGGLNSVAVSSNAALTVASVNASTNRLEGAIHALRDGTKPAMDTIVGSVDRMQRDVGDVARHADSIRGFAEAQHGSTARIADAIDRVDGSTAALADDVRSAKRQDVAEAISKARDALVGIESSVVPKLDEVLRLTRTAPVDYAVHVAASVSAPTQVLQTAIGELRDAIANEFATSRTALTTAAADVRDGVVSATCSPADQQEHLRRSLESLEARLMTRLEDSAGVGTGAATTEIAAPRGMLDRERGVAPTASAADSAPSGGEV